MAKTKNLDKKSLTVEEDATVLGSFQKGKVTRIVVVAKMWQDKLYMDFRQFHMDDECKYHPTKKGFMIPYNQIGDFFDMINNISKV